jgi:hypothetical protein
MANIFFFFYDFQMTFHVIIELTVLEKKSLSVACQAVATSCLLR